jgi:D-sedoheptulose 7-phosphate isomerase
MQLKNSLDKHLKIRKSIEDSIKLKSAILNDNIIQDAISEIIEKIVHCFQNKRKVFFCGNGGSAADSQHLASEFSGQILFGQKAFKC